MSLPKFSATDYFGNNLSSTAFHGKFLLILFLNPRTMDHVDYVVGLSQQNITEETNILVFVDASDDIAVERFLDSIHHSIHNLNLIAEDYSRFKDRFSSPDCCDSFYLFDQGGQLVQTGLDWRFLTNRTLPDLFSGGRKFNNQEFACLGMNVRNIEWFKQLNLILDKNQNHSFYIFSFFTDVCTNCLSGDILAKLKELHETHKDSYFISIILYDNFTENDRTNLQTSLEIKFQVELADPNLLDKWKQLIQKHGIASLSNIIILIDERGKIVKSMFDTEYEVFSNYLVRIQ